MATTLTSQFGYITLNGQAVTTTGASRVQIGLSNVTMLISDSGAFATVAALSGFSGTQFGTGNYATQIQLYNTGSQLYQDMTGMSGWAIATFTGGGGGVGTGGATAANLYLTGHTLYLDVVGLSGQVNLSLGQTGSTLSAELAATGTTLISLISAAAKGVSTLNGLSGILNLVPSGGLTVTTGAGVINLGFTGTFGVTPTGAAGGSLSGTYPNPDTNPSYNASYGSMTVGGLGLFVNGGLTEKRVGYSTGGTVVIDFSLGALAVVGLTTNISFSPSGGSGGVRDGARQTILLYNTLSSTFTITYNSSWKGIGYAVTQVYPGQCVIVELACNGGSESNIYVTTSLVQGPSSSTSGNLPQFAGTNGVQLADSGISAGNIVTQGGNATLSIAAITLCKLIQTSYISNGNIQVHFDDGNFGFILATGNFSLSPGGSSGLGASCWQVISITNTTGSSITIAYNSSWIKVGNFPSTLSPGAGFTLIFQVFGTSESDVICNSTYTNNSATSVTQIVAGTGVTVSPSGGTGVVTVNASGGSGAVSQIVAGTGISVSPSGGTGTVTVTATGSTGHTNNFNVLDYGAVINSSGSASTNVSAWNSAVAACIASGGGCVYWPGLGTFYINATLTVTTSVPITIKGDGKGGSYIMQTSSNQGIFNITKTNAISTIDISGLAFNQNSGTAVSSVAAIQVQMTTGGPSANNVGLSVFNCSFNSVNFNGGNTFTYGVSTTGLTNVYIAYCDYTGTASDGSGTGFAFLPDSAGNRPAFNLCVDHCVITDCNIGVYAPSDANGAPENPQTVMVSYCQITGTQFGIFLGDTTQANIHGNDIEATICCVSCACTWSGTTPSQDGAKTVEQSQICGNLFYMGDSSGNGVYGIVGQIHDSTLNNNTVVSLAVSQTGFRLLAGSTNTIITGNSFQTDGNVMDVVLFDSSTSGNATLGNICGANGSFVDNGSNSIGVAIH